jgi:hypothetical protein
MSRFQSGWRAGWLDAEIGLTFMLPNRRRGAEYLDGYREGFEAFARGETLR